VLRLLKPTLEIFLIFVLIYAVLRFLQGTRGAGIMRGLAFFVVIFFVLLSIIVDRLELYRIDWVMRQFLPLILVYVVILFQPEFRRALMRLGQNPLLGYFFKTETGVTPQIVEASLYMSKNKIGALIAIEREVGLNTFVEGGVRLDSEVTAGLLNTIFWPGTPLHDGAVVIQERRLAAAGCLFPLTENPNVSKTMGTRHRAAIGLTEETDAICVVVSEETGTVSVAMRGQILRGLDAESLRKVLDESVVEGRLPQAASPAGSDGHG
jgi:diadenylate cyclase